MMLSGATIAQNNTNSPYTRYGYGQLADQGSGNSKAMGGIAYGLRDKYQANFANPASYTAVDSLTLSFSTAASLCKTRTSAMSTVKHECQELQFRLHYNAISSVSKRAAMSMGLLPYSNVGI